jgi:hypothetical protein
MDSRFALGCAMSMTLVQFQSKLLMPKIFQEFGIETAGTVIVDRALRVQSLSYSYLSRDSIKVDVGYLSIPILPHFAHPMFMSAHSSQKIPRALDFLWKT